MAAQSKIEKVKELSERIKEAKSIVFVDYKGINVNDDTQFRKETRESGVDYFIAKNRLMKLALKEAGIDGDYDDILVGTTSFALSKEDTVSAAKVVYNFGKGKDIFDIKGGFLEGQKVDIETVMALAKLPTKDELLGQIAYGLLSPVRMLGYALSDLVTKKESNSTEEVVKTEEKPKSEPKEEKVEVQAESSEEVEEEVKEEAEAVEEVTETEETEEETVE